MCKGERLCRKEYFAHFYLNGTPDISFLAWVADMTPLVSHQVQKKWKILTLVAWGLHEVKRVGTKMALLDTLWFARKECRILALLVTNTRKTPKGQGKKMLAPLRANTGRVRHSNLTKERQNYEKKL